ncbi:MAG: flagellar type III secretion system pore protein FliP [Planctomycetales bacterium]|nr:flagellar type III secretion system pore protein FliP [Planctomycetales bacterium]
MGGFAFLTTALVSLTAFTRIVIVFSFVRRALTTQEIPPTPVVLGMSLFLTMFIMGPTIDAVAEKAITPYVDGEVTGVEAIALATSELKSFMLYQTRKDDIALFVELSREEPPYAPEDTKLRVLVPAFMMSELKTAFIMGFCIYIPFMLIDLVVSTILMSLGMMMMPPMMLSLPFKVLLFVLVDGWRLVAQALSSSFG